MALSEKYNGNIVVIKDQYHMWTVMRLQDWCKAVKPRSIESEQILYDLEYKDAGTCDNIMYLDDGEYMVNGSKPLKLPTGMYIVDLKTGKTVGKEAKMQLSAYAKMYEKSHDATITGALVIHTQASTQKGIENLATIYITRDEIEEQYQDYRDIARVWERNFGTRKPTIREIPSIIHLNRRVTNDISSSN